MRKNTPWAGYFSAALFGMACPWQGAVAADAGFDGYSYAVVGTERVRYEERASLLPVTSGASVSNIVLKTGGLYVINPRLDFSLDSSATLLPDTGDETWSLNGDAAGAAYRAANALPSPSNVLQTNDFRLSTNNVMVLLHYKHSPRLRSVYGVNLESASFKRFAWATPQAPTVVLPAGAIEEESTSLYATLGLAYESAGLAVQGSRFHLRALLQAPLWQETTNTAFPDAVFSEAGGFAAQVNGSWNVRVYRGIEAGLYAGYSLREQGSVTTTQGNTRLQLPENTLSQAFAGLQIGWNLSRSESAAP